MKIKMISAVATAALWGFLPAQSAELPKISSRPLNVAVLLYPEVNVLDLSGPLEVFSMANSMAPRRYNVYTVAANRNLVTAENGALTMKPQYSMENSPRADILIVPGASLKQIHGMYADARLMNWIKRASKTSRLTMSVCTGAFLLGHAGVLDNRQSTTHWLVLNDLQREFPKTRAYEGARFIEDGKVLSTAGVSSGLDGSLRVVEKTAGKNVADTVARAIQYRRGTPAFPALKMTRVVLKTPLHTRRSGAQKLVSTVDPVCGMAIDPNTRTTFLYKGQLYGFCSDHCRETFAANPQNYLKTSAAKPQSSTRLSKLVPQLTVRNQPLVNSTIVVDSFTLNRRGWVMSHLQGKDGQPGTMAGVTGPFAPGTYRNVRIKLYGAIKAGDKLWPMLHFDGGTQAGVFEPQNDHHAEVNGKIVTRQITITAIRGTRPKPGAFVVMPPSRMMNETNLATTKKEVHR